MAFDVRRVLEVTWHVDDAAYPRLARNVTHIGVLDDTDVPDADVRGVIYAQWGWSHPGPGITIANVEPVTDPVPAPVYCSVVRFGDGDGDPRTYLFWF